MAMFTMKEV